ncbi:hypothetical protein FOXG_12176 [Fusarium oxysporum f. sp. lycopersici 4287]|uniref:CENP-V/GFA domain-containing protein n=2 Tax=Fusarium oxysporum TaxID=5507 RepID=A0A0J9VNR8_FUSO4|nr:hypothetical protein FOXG_12176 [Fusarium oxysporum f. sp. lycopersici 4287]KAJ9414288.1 Mss4-like protein [Fusarium oxysporum]KNB12613.1 hypothetical protein FOXG_12176 [Fusarium oxysporum f. sp. lycopersici 4287]
MTTEDQNITLTAQCLCKAHTFTTKVPRSKLPLPASVCHCTSCRNATGAMYNSNIDWPGSADEIHNSDLKSYKFTSNCKILFCGSCSCPMFWDAHYKDQPQNFGVFTGVLNNVDVDNLINFTRQIFVGDTVDGGVSPWLQNVNGDREKPRRWMERPKDGGELDEGWPAANQDARSEVPPVTDIPIRCHCKGVDLVFRPGNVDFSTMEADAIPSYIEPKSHKHLATLDPCPSCRLSVGVDIMNWTFVMPQQIDFPKKTNGSNFPRNTHDLKSAVDNPDRDPRYGTLAIYRSSPDVQRYFCSRCSATVFYTVDDRPEVIDVAVALLHAPEGARAESILTWHLGAKMMGEWDFGRGWRKDLAMSVKDTSERWRIEKGYPKTWRRIAFEDAEKKD